MRSFDLGALAGTVLFACASTAWCAANHLLRDWMMA
jgi:hypothetical protein